MLNVFLHILLFSHSDVFGCSNIFPCMLLKIAVQELEVVVVVVVVVVGVVVVVVVVVAVVFSSLACAHACGKHDTNVRIMITVIAFLNIVVNLFFCLL